jgi:transcriptional regulator with XRE-family HTH domain
MNLLQTLRQQSGKTQRQLAEVLGVSQPFIAQVDSGERTLRPESWQRLGPHIALGERTQGEDEEPVWALAFEPEDRPGDLVFLVADDRLGYFAEVRNAEVAANLLRGYGMPAHALPVWASYVGGLAAGSQVELLDRDGHDERKLAASIGRYIADSLEAAGGAEDVPLVLASDAAGR